jgi:cytochrome c6
MSRRKTGILTFPLAAVCLAIIVICYPPGAVFGQDSGESLFKQNCSPCHPNGGNILNPKKTLHRKDREANNIKTAADIVRKMRNPGPVPDHPQDWSGMKMFDKDKISDEDALKIANYILKTFK